MMSRNESDEAKDLARQLGEVAGFKPAIGDPAFLAPNPPGINQGERLDTTELSESEDDLKTPPPLYSKPHRSSYQSQGIMRNSDDEIV